MRLNGKTSRIDLADLSKSRPSEKSDILPRAGVNFRVRWYFRRIVGFSKIGPCFGPVFYRFGSLVKTQK